ncbi:MAG TPA: discoidin domain-containing protein [Polyangiaceae bacterium]|jgi:hypothetical protein|nr:discoidin domain-containing protein [Polyangiaceae bacterium]
MSTIANLRAGFVEVFTLRHASETTAAYGEGVLARVRDDKRTARQRLRSADRLADPVAALVLLTDAVTFATRAFDAARPGEDPFGASADAAAAKALASGERSETFAGRERQRDLVAAFVRRLLSRVEARSDLELEAIRWGRVLGIVLLVGWLVMSYARAHWLVHDVAEHKIVTTSALKHMPPEPQLVVDGHERGAFNVHTSEAHPAFVMVDLGRAYDVQRVRIVNRGDGWFDDILPLDLSISLDDATWQHVATRTEHFDAWNVGLGGRPARFVKVSKNGYIALNKIEVFARE